jgi:hypothetical protein
MLAETATECNFEAARQQLNGCIQFSVAPAKMAGIMLGKWSRVAP